jgi:hypothetical protein
MGYHSNLVRVYFASQGKWRRGISPLRSPRSVRDSLPSYGSYCPADGRKPNSQDAISLDSPRAMRPNQWVALRQWPFSLLYLLNGFVLVIGSSHLWLTASLKPDSTTPSLHLHYTDFNTTKGCSAPVSRLGTLTLVGPPLAFLP